MRYFTARQQRDMLWLRAAGTLSVRGGLARRIAKVTTALATMPESVRNITERRAEARTWMTRFPQIPRLSEEAAQN
jgi:hypothetical protein